MYGGKKNERERETDKEAILFIIWSCCALWPPLPRWRDRDDPIQMVQTRGLTIWPYWRRTKTKYVGLNFLFYTLVCFNPLTSLTAGVMDRRTDRHNKGALGLLVLNTSKFNLSSGYSLKVWPTSSEYTHVTRSCHPE